MKEGIHPDYKECKVTLSVIRSSPVSRSLQTVADVSKSSRTSTTFRERTSKGDAVGETAASLFRMTVFYTDVGCDIMAKSVIFL